VTPPMTAIDDIIIKIDADIKGALAGLTAVDKAVGNMDSAVGKSAAGIRKATTAIVKSFALVGAAAAVGLTVVVGKATMAFGDFEQAVTNAASVTGQSGAQYESTKENIAALSKTLGETTVFSASQAASAMYDLASAGYDVGTMVKSDLKPILDLAAATQSDLTFATETVTSTLGQFGLGIENSDRIADVFAKTIGSSKATIEALSNSLKYVGPVAKSIGMEIEDVNAILGQLYNSGFKGEQAGTALRGALAKLLNPTSAVNGILTDLGITYDQVNPATTNFADTLTLLKNSGIDSNQAMALFGTEAAPAMMALMSNTDGIYELEASLRSAGGAAEDMADKQLDTLKGSLTLLKSALEGLMLTIGEMAGPVIRKFADSLSGALPTIQRLVSEGFVKLKKIITELAPTWDNLKSIASSSIGILKDVFNAFKSGNDEPLDFVGIINDLTTALAKVFKWIDEHPSITKLAVALGVAVVAFAYILPVVAAVVGALVTVGAAVGSAAAFFAGGGTIVTALGIAIAALGGPITIIIVAIALLAGAWATNLFGIRDKTASAVETIKWWIFSFKQAISENMELIKTILSLALGPIGWIITAFQNWDKIKDIVGKISTFLSDAMLELATGAFDWGKNIIVGVIDGIMSMYTGIQDAAAGVANVIKDYLGFGSPTKKGPGRDVMSWGPNMVKGFVSGIENNIGSVNQAFNRLTGPLGQQGGAAAGVGVAGGASQVYNTFKVTIRDTVIREDADIDKLVVTMERKLAENGRGVSF